MKKYKQVWAAALALALLLAGCQAGPGPASQSGQEKPGTVSEQPVEFLSQNQDILGYQALGEDGLYYVDEYTPTLRYIDLASGKDIPLCSSPNCEHNSDSCTSQLGGQPQIVSAGDKLFFFYPGYSDGVNTPVCPTIQMSALDGSGREVLCELKPSQDVGGGVAGNSGELYFTTTEPGRQALMRLDVQAGELQTLWESTDSALFLIGAHEHELVLKELAFGENFEDNQHQLLRYDLRTGERAAVKSWVQGAGVDYTGGSYMYYFYPDGSGTSMDITDLKTGQTGTYAAGFPYLNNGAGLVIAGCYEGYLFVMVLEGYEADGTLIVNEYAIQPQTGQVTLLRFKDPVTKRPLDIVAGGHGRLVVLQNQYAGNSQTSYQGTTYTIASLQDYLAGNDAFLWPEKVD